MVLTVVVVGVERDVVILSLVVAISEKADRVALAS